MMCQRPPPELSRRGGLNFRRPERLWGTTDEAIPVGKRLRPDPQLQRFGDRLERPARPLRIPGAHRGTVPDSSGAAGGRARLSVAARSGVPPRASGALGRGRQAHSLEAEPPPADPPARRAGWLRVRVLRDL